MKLNKFLFFTVFFFTCVCAWAADDETSFHPVNGTTAVVSTAGGKVLYTITDDEGVVKKSIDVDTESKLHLSVGDYRFDGTKGFAVSYLDEGMGVYEVYRIFSYSRKLRVFEELSPSCGDEFLDLKVDSKKKTLTSTYFSENEPKICVTKFGD
jgi:hypothetical protein